MAAIKITCKHDFKWSPAVRYYEIAFGLWTWKYGKDIITLKALVQKKMTTCDWLAIKIGLGCDYI
jgi:hypothetical protein